MYCPNCGTKTSTDQNFCRACGLSLEKIAPIISEQLPTRVDTSVQMQKEKLEKWGVAALTVFGLGLLSFLLYAIGQRLIDKGGDLFAVLVMLGFFIMIVCGLTSVVLFAKANEIGAKATKRQLPAKESESTKELLSEGHFEPVPSVTDRTTELLVAEKRDTHRQ